MFIKKINIDNYKSLKNIFIEDCKSFNIVFGKNNTGKTNILESIAICSNPTYPENIISVNGQRGNTSINKSFWKLYFYKQEIDKPIKFDWELYIPKEKRSLEISIRKAPLRVPNQEILYEDAINGLNFKFAKIDDKNNKSELNPLVFINKGKLDFVNQEDNININKVYLDLYGYLTKDIVLKFDYIIKNRSLEDIIKIMKNLEPELNNIVISSDGFVYIDLGMSTYIPITNMSKSFINIFSIACIIVSSPTSLILIDGIDNSFSNNNLNLISTIIIKFVKKYHSQIFISSSSTEFLRVFNSNMVKLLPNTDELRFHKIDNNKSISYDSKKLELALK